MTSAIDLDRIAQLLSDTLEMVEWTYAHLAPGFKRRAIEALKGALVIQSLTSAGVSETATETAAIGGLS